MNFCEVFTMISNEHQKAITNYPCFASAHEGLAVIEEEFEELKDEVFKNHKLRDYDKMKFEAVQVAAMCIRFILDVAPKKNSIESL